MAILKNINAAFEASDEGITDEYVVEQYEQLIPEMGMDLIGKEKLNDLVFAYVNKEERRLMYEDYLRQGASPEEAGKRADKEAAVLLDEALTSYDKLKKSRKNA